MITITAVAHALDGLADQFSRVAPPFNPKKPPARHRRILETLKQGSRWGISNRAGSESSTGLHAGDTLRRDSNLRSTGSTG
jgi:hypothetical protein